MKWGEAYKKKNQNEVHITAICISFFHIIHNETFALAVAMMVVSSVLAIGAQTGESVGMEGVKLTGNIREDKTNWSEVWC